MGQLIDLGSYKKRIVGRRAEDLDRFIGSNDDFAEANLPQIRSALITCSYDDRQITKFVRQLAANSLLHDVICQWRETARYIGELTKTLETAADRVTHVAREFKA